MHLIDPPPQASRTSTSESWPPRPTGQPTNSTSSTHSKDSFTGSPSHRIIHRSCSREASSSRPTPTGGQLETLTWPDFNHTPTSNRSRTTVTEIASIDLDDGLEFDLEQIEAETIRDDADYPGIRAKITGRLATAVIRFHIDVNIGDPLWPGPQPVDLPRLLDPTPLTIAGYQAELILAEKIVTALQRGTANTRWRDFVDIAALAHRSIDTATIAEAVVRVAEHRETPLEPLAEVLDGYAVLAQPKWSAWRRKQQLGSTPADFSDLLEEIVAFADPILAAL